MHLVDRHRPAQRVAPLRALEPLVVAPTRAVDSQTTDAFAGGTSVWNASGSALDARAARPACGSRTCTSRPRRRRGRTAPRCRTTPSERIGCRRPSQRVEVADDGDRARVRRPDRERGAGDAVDLADVRAEPLVELLVAALHREVEVELAERRQERVRVAQRERVPVRVLDLELVLERQRRLRQQRLPQPAGSLSSASTPPGWTRTACASGR